MQRKKYVCDICTLAYEYNTKAYSLVTEEEIRTNLHKFKEEIPGYIQ
jgi:hypothetical protein